MASCAAEWQSSERFDTLPVTVGAMLYEPSALGQMVAAAGTVKLSVNKYTNKKGEYCVGKDGDRPPVGADLKAFGLGNTLRALR